MIAGRDDDADTRPAAACDGGASLALFLLALLVRLSAFLLTDDVPGDGPVRALAARQFAESPRWIDHGAWLPGFLYLSAGLAGLLPNPSLATRLVNVLAGSLAVPVLHQLVRRCGGLSSARIAAALLALFPLHVGLSVSSLTEALFVLLVLTATVLLATAFDRQAPPAGSGLATPAFVAAVATMGFAELVRSEAWLLAVIVPGFAIVHRRWGAAITSALSLVVVPLYWSFGNSLHRDDWQLGLRVAAIDRSFGPQSASLTSSLTLLGEAIWAQLGWLLAPAAAVGVALEARALVRGRSTLPRRLLLSLTVLFWLGALVFAVRRGPNVWNRYLVLGCVLLLPYAVWPFDRIGSSSPRSCGLRDRSELAPRAPVGHAREAGGDHRSRRPHRRSRRRRRGRHQARLAIDPACASSATIAGLDRFRVERGSDRRSSDRELERSVPSSSLSLATKLTSRGSRRSSGGLWCDGESTAKERSRSIA